MYVRDMDKAADAPGHGHKGIGCDIASYLRDGYDAGFLFGFAHDFGCVASDAWLLRR